MVWWRLGIFLTWDWKEGLLFSLWLIKWNLFWGSQAIRADFLTKLLVPSHPTITSNSRMNIALFVSSFFSVKLMWHQSISCLNSCHSRSARKKQTNKQTSTRTQFTQNSPSLEKNKLYLIYIGYCLFKKENTFSGCVSIFHNSEPLFIFSVWFTKGNKFFLIINWNI